MVIKVQNKNLSSLYEKPACTLCVNRIDTLTKNNPRYYLLISFGLAHVALPAIILKYQDPGGKVPSNVPIKKPRAGLFYWALWYQRSTSPRCGGTRSVDCGGASGRVELHSSLAFLRLVIDQMANCVRSLFSIHFGALPRPAHVAPVTGSRNFGVTFVDLVGLGLRFTPPPKMSC